MASGPGGDRDDGSADIRRAVATNDVVPPTAPSLPYGGDAVVRQDRGAAGPPDSGVPGTALPSGASSEAPAVDPPTGGTRSPAR